MKKNRFQAFAMTTLALLAVSSCQQNKEDPQKGPADLSEEYYSGGKLGTAFNETSAAFEQPTPVVSDGGYIAAFLRGESLFEDPFVTTAASESPMGGLGPLYVRTSCFHCHPHYGHGIRQTEYNSATIGNGYLLVITNENDTYLSSLTGMPQTRAVAPFKAPVDESQISIQWPVYTDEWGNAFDDGETYELIYPEVTIPQSAYYVPLEVTVNGVVTEVPYENVKVRLESTIGIYGTGLLDAIPDDSLKAQYAKEEASGTHLNPSIFANGEWTSLYGTTTHPKRFTYALFRGPLQDAAGSNAIWNITNVTRPDRMKHYMTTTYARVASQDEDVQARFYDIFPQYNITGDVETDIYNYLTFGTDSVKAVEGPEMSENEYIDFMVWHRGLAVPAPRDLDDEDVQRGKELFTQMGCAYCHRPSWTTGDDNFTDPNGLFADGDSRLPRYPNQKIWPYTDMVQHRLYMENDIRTGWCRTTPLWGRGLSYKCTGASDRMHDCRARTVIEAIMWHGTTESEARRTVENFRKLSKSDRDAVVAFIEAI